MAKVKNRLVPFAIISSGTVLIEGSRIRVEVTTQDIHGTKKHFECTRMSDCEKPHTYDLVWVFRKLAQSLEAHPQGE